MSDQTQFPDYLDVDYADGEGESPDDYPGIEAKIEKAIEVTRIGLEQYRNPAIMWTGGKDSTLTLYFVKEVAERFDLDLPPAVFIDHYQHFDELLDFVEHWADEWDLDVVYARNEDVGEYVEANGLTFECTVHGDGDRLALCISQRISDSYRRVCTLSVWIPSRIPKRTLCVASRGRGILERKLKSRNVGTERSMSGSKR